MFKNLSIAGARVGSDPEGFFERDGKIISSEEILKEPVIYKDRVGYERGRVVRDGIQLEIQPLASHCRANAGNFIQCALIALDDFLKANHPGVTVKFYQSVEIPKDYFDTLPQESRQLGCMPSKNLYRPRELDVDPLTYRLRSAGGHLHLGQLPFEITEDLAKRLVRIMDVVVGNTCVLIDRDPGNAVRRKVYGRAGEYRLPKWGLEYRTLSNFWLHAYPLQSLVYALARQAVSMVFTTEVQKEQRPEPWNPEEELLSLVNMKDVVKAINTNDLGLAKKNWAAIREFVKTYWTQGIGINNFNLEDFEYFAGKVQEHGLNYYWPDDPFQHWINKPEGHGCGWESFLADVVYKQRVADAEREKVA